MIWEQEQEEDKQNAVGSQSMLASFRKVSRSMSKKQKEGQVYSREPASVVEDVVLLGCPASVNSSTWLSCREVVGGRLVNCFSQRDMILALLYRYKNVTQILTSPAGICPAKLPGIENYDVSQFVGSHAEYAVAVREILSMVGYNQPATGKAGGCTQKQ